MPGAGQAGESEPLPLRTLLGSPGPAASREARGVGSLAQCAAPPALGTLKSWKHCLLQPGRAGQPAQENPEGPKGEPSTYAQLL